MRRVLRAFGRTVDDWPTRYSNAGWARLCVDKTECTYCFPHGLENTNSKYAKDLRCWKMYRRRQYRTR